MPRSVNPSIDPIWLSWLWCCCSLLSFSSHETPTIGRMDGQFVNFKKIEISSRPNRLVDALRSLWRVKRRKNIFSLQLSSTSIRFSIKSSSSADRESEKERERKADGQEGGRKLKILNGNWFNVIRFHDSVIFLRLDLSQNVLKRSRLAVAEQSGEENIKTESCTAQKKQAGRVRETRRESSFM